mgnify:CR=1 FL=1
MRTAATTIPGQAVRTLLQMQTAFVALPSRRSGCASIRRRSPAHATRALARAMMPLQKATHPPVGDAEQLRLGRTELQSDACSGRGCHGLACAGRRCDAKPLRPEGRATITTAKASNPRGPARFRLRSSAFRLSVFRFPSSGPNAAGTAELRFAHRADDRFGFGSGLPSYSTSS